MRKIFLLRSAADFMKSFFKRLWYLFFRNSPYTYIGRLAVKILPESYISNVRDEYFFVKGHTGFLVTAIKKELDKQYHSLSEQDKRRLNRKKFWGGAAGKKWHDTTRESYRNTEKKFTNEFIKLKLPLIGQISELLSEGSSYHTLCEIGTGNGVFLEYLSRQFPFIEKWVGIDLNMEQIRENNETYSGSSLKFVHAEIMDWVNTQCEAGTIFVGRTTFEYFTQSELTELLKLIYEKVNPAAIALCEPVCARTVEGSDSIPRDSGISFYHHYPFLLEQCNYRIFRQEVTHLSPEIFMLNMTAKALKKTL